MLFNCMIIYRLPQMLRKYLNSPNMGSTSVVLKSITIDKTRPSLSKPRAQHKSTISYKTIIQQPLASSLTPLKNRQMREDDQDLILDTFMQRIDQQCEVQREQQNKVYFATCKVVNQQLRQYQLNMEDDDILVDFNQFD